MYGRRKQVVYVRYVIKDVYKTKDKKEREEKIIEIIKKQIIRNK